MGLDGLGYTQLDSWKRSGFGELESYIRGVLGSPDKVFRVRSMLDAASLIVVYVYRCDLSSRPRLASSNASWRLSPTLFVLYENPKPSLLNPKP